MEACPSHAHAALSSGMASTLARVIKTENNRVVPQRDCPPGLRHALYIKTTPLVLCRLGSVRSSFSCNCPWRAYHWNSRFLWRFVAKKVATSAFPVYARLQRMKTACTLLAAQMFVCALYYHVAQLLCRDPTENPPLGPASLSSHM